MYRNVASYTKNGRQIVWLATWDEEGNRIEQEHVIKPYLYYEDQNSKETKVKSMYNKPVRFLEFDTNFERSEWIKETRDTLLFEKLSSEKQFLLNQYIGQENDPDFAKFPLKVYFFDIEVELDPNFKEFPSPELAELPINVISIYNNLEKKIYVWAYRKDVFDAMTDLQISKIQKEVAEEFEEGLKIEIRRFEREFELLNDFLRFFENNCPDVLTGWNIDGFDIPYLINRIRKILPEGSERRLSPIAWHKNAIRITREQKNKQTVIAYHIMGLSVIDYLLLYKKFRGGSQQSFKLDYIAKVETGKGKLDYYELGYDSLLEFMTKDFATFVKYNIIDSTLVKQIDDNMSFITLARRVCNIGLVEYENVFKTVPPILGALCIQAREMGMVFLTDKNKGENAKEDDSEFQGAFVFPTTAGYYPNGIMSFDFNSLYPNVMMSCNISPETMVGKVVNEIADETKEIIIRRPNGTMVKMSNEQFDELLQTKCCKAANNVLYIKPAVKFGIIPTFLDSLYKKRKATKKESKANEKKAHELDDQIKELEKQLKEMK